MNLKWVWYKKKQISQIHTTGEKLIYWTCIKKLLVSPSTSNYNKYKKKLGYPSFLVPQKKWVPKQPIQRKVLATNKAWIYQKLIMPISINCERFWFYSSKNHWNEPSQTWDTTQIKEPYKKMIHSLKKLSPKKEIINVGCRVRQGNKLVPTLFIIVI